MKRPKRLVFFFSLLLYSLSAFAQAPTTIDCGKGLAYIVSYRGEGVNALTDLYSFDLSSGTATLVKQNIVPNGFIQQMNAIGYSSTDGYMYGFVPSQGIFKLGANGEIESVTISDPDNLLNSVGLTSGDIFASAYYLYDNNSKKIIAIDLNVSPAVVSTVNVDFTDLDGSIDDFVFGPDGNLYGVTSNLQVFKISITGATGTFQSLGPVVGTGLFPSSYGTAFMDTQGNLFFGQNTTGTLYRIAAADFASPSSSINAVPFSTLTGIYPADGARCRATVPPSAQNDSTSFTSGNTTPLILPILENDNIGTFAIDPSSVVFYNDSTSTIPDDDGQINLAGKGVFKLNADGTVTFTPDPGFQQNDGDAIIWYTVSDIYGNPSNKAFIKVTTTTPLPITLGAFGANLINGELMITWSTLSETNNDYFEIELSNDGKQFKPIGKVMSKAENGNSATPLNYDFATTVPEGGMGLLGMAMLSGIAILLINKRNRMLFVLAMLGIISLLTITSCSKQGDAIENETGKLYVRLKQVDKDGTIHYSKVIEVVKK